MEIGISPHCPTSPPLSPCSPDSGLCSPPSFQSPLHPSALAHSVSVDSTHQLPRQAFEGYVSRRSAVLKRWKDKKHITIVAGQQFLEIKKHGKKSKALHSFSVQAPNILIEPLSADPKNDDFLGIRVINQMTKNELERFRMDDIVQMRQMMVALGSSGTGIFSSEPPPTIEAEEAYWASKTPQQAIKPILHYDETVMQLPIEFYFSKKPSGIEIIPSQVGGVITPFSKPLPQCIQQKQPEPQKRRPWHDTFRPPLGPEVYVPLSMGYGEEVGLQKGRQAIWDPVLKAYVVLDHNTKERINDDLRKPHKRPTEVTKRVVEFKDRHDSSLKSKYKVCTDANVLQASSSCARARPHAYELNACGRDGIFGYNGNQGACGADGHPGHCGAAKRENGCRGGNGWPGNPGTCGLNGMSGANASDVVLFLQGDSKELKVTGSCSQNVNLGGNHNEEIMFVNCRGGDGGKGGDGGSGGRGGDGGAGGDGAPGEKGIDASGERRGGNGGPGGNGGCGGTGGTGGRGGDGGQGGNSGAGGTCIICATDPKLFVLVEVDALSGDPGQGGRGGHGGPWGNGGVGGQGGPGGPGGRGSKVNQEFFTNEQNQVNTFGNDGACGSPGGVGNCGQQGANGNDGSTGQRAPNGSIAWVVCSEEGTIVQQAGTRYDVQVKSYKIVPENDDGIYEPNERIAVSEVVLTNVGSLPLPAGAEALMENSESKTINFEPIRFKLPEIQPGESVQVPTTFYGRIFDQPPPNTPDRFQSSADFRSRVELLGRPFQKSSVPKKLTVQYPIRIKSLHCSENVGRGEVAIFEIEVENISTKAYGTCRGSAGEVDVHMHMDARLIPIAHGDFSEDKAVPYTIMYDTTKQDSLYIQVSSIPPKKTLTLRLAVQMASEAELFDYCQWQADLCLRGKVIEYKHEKIRISPIYKPQDQPGDILMVTSPAISRATFVLWEKIFQILGATVDYWDTTRHNGLSEDNSKGSQHPNTWIGLYDGKMVLFPHCDLQLLRGSHIVQHFHGKSEQRPDLGSGMLLLMPSASPRGVKFDRFQDRGDVAVLQHLVSVDRALPLPKGGYGGKHMTAPNSTEPYLKWEQQTLEQKEKENPSFEACVLSRQTKIESKGAFKYTYGEVDIRNCPLRRSCKFVAIDGAGGSISEVGVDDPNVEKLNLSNMTINEIPLATNFGQVLLQTLYGLSIRVKLNLIKGRDGHSHSITASLPNGLQLTLKQLSAICLAYEIADEVLGCSKTISRVNTLLEDVLANKADYTSNAELMMQLLNLTEKELQERKKKYDFSSMTPVIKETKKVLERVKQAVRESNRRASNPSQNVALPGLSVLRNTLHVHYSHQHTVKDERWNLMCK